MCCSNITFNVITQASPGTPCRLMWPALEVCSFLMHSPSKLKSKNQVKKTWVWCGILSTLELSEGGGGFWSGWFFSGVILSGDYVRGDYVRSPYYPYASDVSPFTPYSQFLIIFSHHSAATARHPHAELLSLLLLVPLVSCGSYYTWRSTKSCKTCKMQRLM